MKLTHPVKKGDTRNFVTIPKGTALKANVICRRCGKKIENAKDFRRKFCDICVNRQGRRE